MLYKLFLDTANKFPHNMALNNFTYQELVEKIDNINYEFIVEDQDYNVLIRILNAAKINKPITILPKHHRDKVELPVINNSSDFKLIMYSSGSTGQKRIPKIISESMLLSNIKNVTKIQNLTYTSKVLTVCSLNHTGGINTQSIPGLMCGAHIITDNFNAFNYSSKLKQHNITHSHLLPAYVEALIKNNNKLPNNLELIMIGADCVLQHHIKYMLDQQIAVMQLYGLTEAGPPAIYHLWNINDDTSVLSSVNETEQVFLGSKCLCDFKIINNELFLKGDIIASDDWLATGDCVQLKNEWFMYQGRKIAGCKIIPKAH